MKGKGMPVVLILCSLLSFSGCGGGIYEIVARDQRDPDTFYLKVDSFSEENVIRCSWAKDERSDKYIVMRSEDREPLHFEKVYEGERTTYEDAVLKEDTRYLYRLDKVRGKRGFKGKTHYMGIYSKQVKDVYEPNDKKENAVRLENDKQANVYYYRSTEGTILEDEDWYKVRVPARRQAKITIIYDGANKPFIITKPYNGEQERPATNGAVVIKNDMDYEKELRFKISLDKNIVVSGSAGGAYYPYTLRLLSIE